jgi:hypothetical protein
MHVIDTSDFSLETSRVEVRPAANDPTDIVIKFLIDHIAREDNESLTLQLLPTPSTLQTIPTGEAVFFKNIIELTIVDADRKFEMPLLLRSIMLLMYSQ